VLAKPNEKRGSVDGLEDWFCAQLMEEFPLSFDTNKPKINKEPASALDAVRAKHGLGQTADSIKYAAKEVGRQFQEKLADLSTDAPITVNENGRKQSYIPFRFDLLRGIAAKVIMKLAGVLKHGSKYGEDNWHNISPQEHINHAQTHLFAWLSGDDQDDHVSHFVCRAVMFAATLEDPRWKRIGPGNYVLNASYGAAQAIPKFDTSITSPFKGLEKYVEANVGVSRAELGQAETPHGRDSRHKQEFKDLVERQRRERGDYV